MKLITEAGKQLLGLTKKFGKKVGSNFAQAGSEMGGGQIAATLLPDLAFGGLYGAMTPGDLNDKLIAGAGSAIGGAAGGVGLRMGLGIKGPVTGLMTDFAGSYAGDIAGQAVSDQVLGTKHGGMTPLEKQQMQYQLELEESIRQQVLREYGINPHAIDQQILR
jgi:hypothetical protein